MSIQKNEQLEEKSIHTKKQNRRTALAFIIVGSVGTAIHAITAYDEDMILRNATTEEMLRKFDRDGGLHPDWQKLYEDITTNPDGKYAQLKDVPYEDLKTYLRGDLSYESFRKKYDLDLTEEDLLSILNP